MCLHRVPQKKNPPDSSPRTGTDELAREQWCCYTALRKSFGKDSPPYTPQHCKAGRAIPVPSHMTTKPAIPKTPLLSEQWGKELGLS